MTSNLNRIARAVIATSRWLPNGAGYGTTMVVSIRQTVRPATPGEISVNGRPCDSIAEAMSYVGQLIAEQRAQLLGYRDSDQS